jgi:EmrB/QacA subfamily drug resistance transporter
MVPRDQDATPGLRLTSTQGRGLVAAAALGSGMAFLDATVVNVALPTIGRDLDADLAALQWTVNAYTLTLASLILLGGSLADRLGRRRVFLAGVLWFAAASLLCALAPSVELLIAFRALQGVGGALMTPGSLAMIQASVHPDDRGRAIGLWSGLTGLSSILGPFLGGWLIELDWRLIFGVNLPLAAATILLTLRCVPETRDERAGGRLDVAGAVLGAVALGSATYALIAAGSSPRGTPVLVTGLVAVAAAVAFFVRERTAPAPMVPPQLFANRVFAVANLLTLAVYAALSGLLFLLVIQLQVSLGWSPLQAGVATLPSTLLMVALSARAGALVQRTGPRLPLTVGPWLAAAGVAYLVPLSPGDTYLTGVLPGVLLFGAGLTVLVAPLTATVMAAAPERLAGTASGVNNAVARTAGLLAVAALPTVAGLGGRAYTDPVLLTPAYRTAMLVCVALLVVGGLVALVGLPARAPVRVPVAGARPPAEAAARPTAPCATCGGAPTLGG